MRALSRWALLSLMAAAIAGCKSDGKEDEQAKAEPTIDPARYEAALAAGRASLDRGNYATAEGQLTEALEFMPEEPEALELRGRARWELGLAAAAAEDLSQAADATSGHFGSTAILVDVLEAAGRYEEAADAAEDWVIEDAEDAERQMTLGVLQLKLERFTDARDSFALAADLAPGAPSLLYLAGEAALRARRFDDAMGFANAALECIAEDPEVEPDPLEANRALLTIVKRYYMRGAEGDAEQAQAYIAEFDNQTTGAPDAQAALGVALLEAGQPEQALPRLRGIAADAPPWAHRALAESLLRLGRDFDIALAEARLAAADEEASGLELAVLGWAEWKTGDSQAASGTLATAVELIAEPSVRARCHYQLSKALESLGQVEGAQEHLDMARKLGYPVGTD